MQVVRTVPLFLLSATLIASPALATIPYTPVAPRPFAVGPGVPKAAEVFGKEYSHDFDQTTLGGGGGPDPQQVINWDGIGGVSEGVDFSFTRPDWTPNQEVDAIAHSRDALFRDIREDSAHLVFSHDDMTTAYLGPAAGYAPAFIPAAGPVFLSNGNTINGAGEVSIERAGVFAPPSTQSGWATQGEVNGMPLPRDVDGLELWGPEPPENEPMFLGDADKYSLELDFASGVSVWNASGTPYIPHASIVGVVTTLLGPLMGPEMLPFDDQEGENAINLDALMVRDFGEMDVFDGDATGGGGPSDSIIFSIRQIIDPTDPSGYYATGSELFFYNGDGTFGFLDHGGHTWDKGYALGALRTIGADGNAQTVIDINAIEAVTAVPEPAGAALLVAFMASAATMRWRLG